MISWGVAKVTRKLNLTSTARQHLPTSFCLFTLTPKAVGRKHDLQWSKLFCWNSLFVEHSSLMGGRWGKVWGLVMNKDTQRDAVRLISFIWFLSVVNVCCSVTCNEENSFHDEPAPHTPLTAALKGARVCFVHFSLLVTFSPFKLTVNKQLRVKWGETSLLKTLASADSSFVLWLFTVLAACYASFTFMHLLHQRRQ